MFFASPVPVPPASRAPGSRFLPAMVLAVMLSGTPAFPQNASNSNSTQSVSGIVLNSMTQQPVPRVLVYSSDNRFATMTDDEGRFHFAVPVPTAIANENLTPRPLVSNTFITGAGRGPLPSPAAVSAPIYLLARRPGFLPTEGGEQIVAQAGDENIIVPITPEARIVGRVLLPTSDYLDRMQVELFRREFQNGSERWQNIGSKQSRADGSFRFADLIPGDYKLITQELLDRDPVVFHPGGPQYGYPPAYFPSAPGFSTAQIIHLTPGITFQANLSPVRREYHQVRIQLGDVPPGLNIEVFAQNDPGPGYSLGFNPEESTIQGMLPNGSYTVRAKTFGENASYGSANLTVNGAPAEASMVLLPTASIPVIVREQFEDPQTMEQFRAMFNATRHPRLVSPNLQPVESFGNIPGATLRQPRDPDDETLEIVGVYPGTYRLEVTSPIGYVASAECAGTDLLHKPLVVGLGSTISPVAITVRDDGAHVSGKVEVMDGGKGAARPGRLGPVRQIAVYFLPTKDSTGQFRTAWTSPDGQFNQMQLPPGDYRVFAAEQNHPEFEFAAEEMLIPYAPAMRTIQVTAHQQLVLQLSLPHPEE